MLRRAQFRYTGDVWVNYDLAQILERRNRRGDAIRFYTAARAIRPETAHNLAHSLANQGESDEAIEVFRDLARLRPKMGDHLDCLGAELKNRGRHNEAAVALEQAVAAYREAIRLRPDLAEAHSNLGNALGAQGKIDEAVTECREAIRLRPDYAGAHSNLGLALHRQGKISEAVAEWREAIRLRPDYTEAHCNLGTILRKQGDYADSLAMYRRGHELGSKQRGWGYPSAQWVAQAERLAALAGRLPALLKGDDRPKDNSERLALAQMCYDTKRQATAARFWAEALETDPKLGDDRRVQQRYNAACAAALAGTGQGKDDPPPDNEARTKLRGLALGWLKADLAAWAKVLESGPYARKAQIAPVLKRWKADADLAAIRDAEALGKLAEAERADWRALWAEVEAMLAKVVKP